MLMYCKVQIIHMVQMSLTITFMTWHWQIFNYSPIFCTLFPQLPKFSSLRLRFNYVVPIIVHLGSNHVDVRQ
jgi:hypothetical protein